MAAALLPLEAGFWQIELEEQATAILHTDRALQGTAISVKKDWLSPDQLLLRMNREVYSGHEIDPLVESGLYRRAFNPRIRTRPTRRGRYSRAQDPWQQDGFDSFGWTGAALPSYSRLDRLVEGGWHYTWDIMLPHKDVVEVRHVVML